MKKLILLFVLLVATANASVTYVQGAEQNSGKTAVMQATLTMPAASNPSDKIIIFVSLKNTAATVQTLTNGSFLTSIANGTTEKVEVWSASGGVQAISIQLTAKSTLSVFALDFSGISSIGALNSTTGNNAVVAASESLAQTNTASVAVGVLSSQSSGALGIAADSFTTQLGVSMSGSNNGVSSSVALCTANSGAFAINGTGPGGGSGKNWAGVLIELVPA